MSGPKDYVYLLSEGRRAAIRARREQERRARQAATQARLTRQRETARKEAKLAAQLRAATMQRLENDREIARQRRQATAEQEASPQTQAAPSDLGVVVPPEVTPVSSAAEGNDLLSSSKADAAPVVEEQCDSVADEQSIQELHPWLTELEQDESVGFYQKSERVEWQSRYSQLLNAHAAGDSPAALQAETKALSAQAEAIHTRAGAIQEQFATRNELLADMIGALQEIGFYVADPHFENPADPAGPVLLKATRGSETMEAAVDLSDTIRSVWNGLPDQQCKDAFFDYVDQLQHKGIHVAALRSDLQQRPELKQQGALDLPQSAQRHKERG